MVYIGLGANLGDPAATFGKALRQLSALPAYRERARSSLYGSAPVGGPPQPDYYNLVVAACYRGSPSCLLKRLGEIETLHGRQRRVVNGPRTLDLDILIFGRETVNLPDLIIPHPRLAERAFVLLPLLELAPELPVPGYEQTVTRLWENMDPRLKREQRIERIA
ncbi:MAG: 2-amino-4-hydroxy-6-hydroxymethyldihydropteridine diphosphokinase [Desulfarculales bacterium]|nr:2-amino-4-hydroxy-6-hydroxymethyldihydropteridine diphosphokinase [Desulfarculales bacterium]